ncbi:MAG: replication-associated recombination protein A [Chloroherpetonaceae bacterium]|nr:replication-associated recombination protein A [Chloroherpetonaceae bacterium]
MNDLFESEESLPDERHTPIGTSESAPLAERMRPKVLYDVIGQAHLLGEGAPLRRFFDSGRFLSMIFWGPPGTGKTTLARLIAKKATAHFISLSAIDSGVKEVRASLEDAKRMQSRGKKTILFIDEIHRFNKSQQDSLLGAVESGLLTLIGATTENPSFEVNAALLSRCKVYHLHPLSETEILHIVNRALTTDPWLSSLQPQLESPHALFAFSGGDARGALGAIEAAALLAASERETSIEKDPSPLVISIRHLELALQQKTPQYDKKGESHYDTISAFIKSLRGSDPDAALFWLAKMIDAGEEARFIARRMVIFASEDIGNAEPQALQVAVSVFQAVELIGMPEARINLAQGVTFLASCPKSNASYNGIEAALSRVKGGADLTVPLHLRNGPTSLMKAEGYGREYKYPHLYDGHFIREHYFPPNATPEAFYKPTEEGKEKALKERLEKLWNERYNQE